MTKNALLEKGQKIWAIVDPPPPHSGNALKKKFFFIDVFPNFVKYGMYAKYAKPVKVVNAWVRSAFGNVFWYHCRHNFSTLNIDKRKDHFNVYEDVKRYIIIFRLQTLTQMVDPVKMFFAWPYFGCGQKLQI